MPDCVIIHADDAIKIYSLKSSSRDDCCLALFQDATWICFHKTCLEQREVYMSSKTNGPFSCRHIGKIGSSVEEPIEKYSLNDDLIGKYPADQNTVDQLTSLAEEINGTAIAFKVSEKAFVVYG